MRKLRRRVDENQSAIVRELRDVGYSVAVTSSLGDGFPDIVVGCSGRNFMFEIKNPDKMNSNPDLTPDELDWHEKWKGQVSIIKTAREAMDIIWSNLQ